MNELHTARKVPTRQVGLRWMLVVALAAAATTWFSIERDPAGRRAAPAPADDDVGESAAGFQPTIEHTAPAPAAAPEGMVWIPGGEFSMGAAEPEDMQDLVGMQATRDARPVHRVSVDGFWMDRTEVTNDQFAAFVAATGYVTVAERTPRPEDFPGVPAHLLVAGSLVFSPPPGAVPLNDERRWWRYAKGATWRHPFGIGSTIEGKGDHPVVHVAYEPRRGTRRVCRHCARRTVPAEWLRTG